MDARTSRTRARLHDAVLELAAREPIVDVTAAAVCRTADVTRDTFYRHTTDPVTLLGDALAVELDDVIGDAPDGPIGVAERRLLQHVAHRADVYRGAMRPVLAAPVRSILEQHLREGLHRYAVAHPEIVPPALVGEDDLRLAAAYAAGGTVGAVEEWLRTGSTDVEHAARAVLAASPSWWLRADDPDPSKTRSTP
ncbi:TetR/AcrR family transcriptional regulator [Luteimicrobium sp. DT211]|uniref:TetR/AcrR family transcriptional regulator n=1 Tax=Luteimicrobium sp. DT211 TaxID=3393412 RepID=UPI003CECA9AB